MVEINKRPQFLSEPLQIMELFVPWLTHILTSFLEIVLLQIICFILLHLCLSSFPALSSPSFSSLFTPSFRSFPFPTRFFLAFTAFPHCDFSSFPPFLLLFLCCLYCFNLVRPFFANYFDHPQCFQNLQIRVLLPFQCSQNIEIRVLLPSHAHTTPPSSSRFSQVWIDADETGKNLDAF